MKIIFLLFFRMLRFFMRAESTPFLDYFLHSLSFCIFLNITQPGGKRFYEEYLVLSVNDGDCFLSIHGKLICRAALKLLDEQSKCMIGIGFDRTKFYQNVYAMISGNDRSFVSNIGNFGKGSVNSFRIFKGNHFICWNCFLSATERS